eukprot:3759348-Amphidinium_carterae.1
MKVQNPMQRIGYPDSNKQKHAPAYFTNHCRTAYAAKLTQRQPKCKCNHMWTRFGRDAAKRRFLGGATDY